MRSFCKLWLPAVVAFLTVFTALAFAQINPDEAQGMKPYDTWHGGDLDSISVTNGALTLHVPIYRITNVVEYVDGSIHSPGGP